MDLSAATWSDLSGLLDEAFDLEPAERAAWLDRQAGQRPERAAVLRKLLAAHATSETADLLARDAERTGLAAGERVGPYRLVRELGSGGMADVWLAERADGALERVVALKLPRTSRLRRDLRVRFERERDILARLPASRPTACRISRWSSSMASRSARAPTRAGSISRRGCACSRRCSTRCSTHTPTS
jgi:serine/threonine protein kinase